MNADLLARLDAGRRYDCEYDNGLSNHLPMALIALYRLGADAGRLQAFEAAYAPRLPAAPPAVTWLDGDAWTSRLGDRSAYAAYLDLFGRWRLEEGAGAMLSQVLPALMPGCGGVAFHGLIRTAYGVSSRHAGELVAGLAYWACRSMPVFDGPVTPNAKATETDPERLLRQLTITRSDARLIAERMRHAARMNRGLRDAWSALAVGPGTLESLARLASKAYVLSGSFTALHLVTSAHALRLLLPLLDEPLVAVRHYWHAFATAVVVAGLERSPAPSLVLPWSEIVARAVQSMDEHVIKLVDSVREQSSAYRDGNGSADDLWQVAAIRAVC